MFTTAENKSIVTKSKWRQWNSVNKKSVLYLPNAEAVAQFQEKTVSSQLISPTVLIITKTYSITLVYVLCDETSAAAQKDSSILPSSSPLLSLHTAPSDLCHSPSPPRLQFTTPPFHSAATLPLHSTLKRSHLPRCTCSLRSFGTGELRTTFTSIRSGAQTV